ncbi:type 1 glutamine amidotransferase [Syntrophomonas erecta]
MAEFVIAHLYPDLMNLYGDRGNLICLQKRLEWYGHTCNIWPIALGEWQGLDGVDMVFMGGGSDREQDLVYRDLVHNIDKLMKMVEQGMPGLFICGAYQLLGKYYEASDGKKMDGLGLFNIFTQAETPRLIGNILIEADLGELVTVVGFENHAGRTYLNDSTLKPLGRVLNGLGNNGKDGTEGMRFNNLIGTYMHGPLLPKNPAVADFLIQAMVNRRGINLDRILDDRIEMFAHQQVKRKIMG